MAYPTGIKVYIDGKDCTYYLFGAQYLDVDSTKTVHRDIPITSYLRKTGGRHTIEIVPTEGAGRVEVRLEIR